MAKIKDFYIRETDSAAQPAYYAQILNESDESAVNLVGATITFTMIDSIERTVKIDAQSTGISIVDGANGKVKYSWQAGDLNTPGLYVIYFNVTPASGDSFTFPSGGLDRGGTLAYVIVTELQS